MSLDGTKRLHGWAIAGAALLLCGLLAMMAVDRVMRSSAIDDAMASADGNAQILASGLQSELQKFSLVPPVLAEDPDVIALMKGDRSRAAILNRRLATLAEQTQAAVIYLLDADGRTLSSSNHASDDSFIGSVYGFRAYFREAMAQGAATQFALGTVSRRPGLYIARRIGNPGSPLGVVALKVEFAALEKSWRASGRGVFVVDGSGVVLITSNPDWRFHALDPEAATNRNREEDLRALGVARFAPLELPRRYKRTASVPLDTTGHVVAPEGWTMHLLVDPSRYVGGAVSRGRLAVALAMAVLVMLGALAFYLRRRREEAREADLARRTDLLRQQLSQANRLATLGQIGAGISHEIRQPVAAMRVFAENGEKLVENGELDRAKGNFAQISRLADRIGTITGELLRFSRRGTRAQRAMPIGQAIDGALLLLNDRIAGLDVEIALPDAEARAIEVVGEHVRLEQVLVNLLQNALDAVGTSGRIAIEVATRTDTCLVVVSDDGPGLDQAAMDRLFHPFATTKDDGLGLGLVISQEIMRDLGGDLRAEPSESGARFVMEVPLA